MDDFVIKANPKPEKNTVEHLLTLINKNVNRQGNALSKSINANLETLNKNILSVNQVVAKKVEEQTKLVKTGSTKKDKSKDFEYSNFMKQNLDQYGLIGKTLNSVFEKSVDAVNKLKDFKFKKDEDTQTESRKKKDEASKENKQLSFFQKLFSSIKNLGKIFSRKDKTQKEKSEGFGLLDVAKNIGSWFSNIFSSLGKVLLPKLLALVPNLLSKLLPIAAIGLAVTGAFSKVKEIFEHGFAETVAKDQKKLEDAFENGFFNGLWYSITHPIDALVGLGGKLGDYITDSLATIIDSFQAGFNWITELPGKLWDKVRGILPSWLGGKSDEEKEDDKKRKESGLDKDAWESYKRINKGRKMMGDDEMSLEDFKKSEEQRKATAEAIKASDNKETRKKVKQQLAENYYKQPAVNVKQQAESKNYIDSIKNGTATQGILSYNRDIDKKYGSVLDTTVKQPAVNVKQPEPTETQTKSQSAQQTTVINNNYSSSGVELEDVIGSSSIVAINMSRN